MTGPGTQVSKTKYENEKVWIVHISSERTSKNFTSSSPVSVTTIKHSLINDMRETNTI